MRIAICTTLVFLLMPCPLQAQDAPKEITNSIGMKLVLIPRGTFMMGSPIEEEKREEDEQQHEVTITNDYYLGVTEVTQGQYEKVMGTNPSRSQKTGIRNRDFSMYPVNRASWEDAVEFCKKLSELPGEKKAGRVYRLPSEAEWEYACRAGSKTAHSFEASSRSLDDYAWILGNSSYGINPVGEKQPNAWGLFDMHGNVWEWCSDWLGDYPKVKVSDPGGPTEGSYRILRGGSWDVTAAYCRSASRHGLPPDYFYGLDLGFRVAMTVPSNEK